MAYHYHIIEENNEESIRLLKNLADMEIEDFPSINLEQIRKTQKDSNLKRKKSTYQQQRLAMWKSSSSNP
ncbi:hypothetical protein Gotur_003911 [Gossypium turneri]